jgi:hypothetical protein
MKKEDIENMVKALRLISQFTDENHKPTFEATIAIETLLKIDNIGFAIDEN